jgi:hypothetical protein
MRPKGVGVPSLRDFAKVPPARDTCLCLKGCATARGVVDDDLAKVSRTWTTPPEIARPLGEVDRVIHL